MNRWGISKLLAGVFAVMLSAHVSTVNAFDFDHGQAPLEVVVPTVLPTLLQVYPGASDASLVLRATAMVSNSWFDAIAPYHPTAVGVYSRLERRPPAEGVTNRTSAVIEGQKLCRSMGDRSYEIIKAHVDGTVR